MLWPISAEVEILSTCYYLKPTCILEIVIGVLEVSGML